MDEKELKLREHIRKMVREMLDEISTTSAVPGYLTPNAFSGEKDRTASVDRMAKRIGYTLTNRGKKDNKGDKLEETYTKLKSKFKTLTENYYYEYKKDTSALPHQKIGKAISEINKQIKMVERMLHFNNRLKNEYGVSNEKLWKRTQNQMTKLEGRLVEMARRLREMRG
jgi:hypothetical protein